MRPAGALHDMELITRAAVGDHAAFGELARRHVATVRTLLRRLGADSRQADALAQEAFLDAFERIGDFHGEGAFAGWIKRIAARRYLKRCQRGLKLDGVTTSEAETDAAADITSGDFDVALAGLPVAERVCLGLSFGAGLTQAEIAEAVGASPGAVKASLERAVAKLRRSIGAPARDPVALA